MEKSSVDELLKTCEQEKLHLSGMIQPFASLIVLEKETFLITHVSNNIKEFLEFDVDELLGSSLDEIFPTWIELISLLHSDLKHPYVYTKIKDKQLYLKISENEKDIVIDIQKSLSVIDEKEIKKNDHKLYITPDSRDNYIAYLESYMDIVFNSIKFDRVMLYAFQDDFSGKVISERISDKSLGSYLNLRFPASDIPKIARDLYMINPSRSIVDVDATNVDIVSLDDSIPDLTYSDIRSVSPVHIEYLKNMGVKSSFSIPIIVSGQLWGLLACHNLSKRYIDSISKNIAIEQTKMFALGIQNFRAKEKLNYLDNVKYKINDIVNSVISSSNKEESILEKKDSILNLIDSDGFIIITDEKVLAFGEVPNQEGLVQIDHKFLESNELVMSCNSIVNELFEGTNYLGPSGLLGVKAKFNNDITIRCYWFRHEFVEELHWAGNPDKPVVENAGVFRLSPRRSFEKFIELRRGYSKKFDKLDNSTALKFSNKLFKYLVRGV